MDSIDKWNPLISMNQPGFEDLIIQSNRKQIRNILKSYVGYFDPFCELIQNAMDAIDKRTKFENSSFEGKIKIEIDLLENSIYVADNGIGFTQDEFHSFLSPNVSFKNMSETRGHKGVGATYLAFGFNDLKIKTKSPNYSKTVGLKNGRSWVFDEKSELPLVETLNNDELKFPFDRGTAFKVILKDNNGKKVTDLSWRGLSNAKAWSQALLLNSPLGNINFSQYPKPITFDIQVKSLDENITEEKNIPAEYLFPHKILPNTSQLISDFDNWRKKRIQDGLDISKTPQRFKLKQAIFNFYDLKDLKNLAKRSGTLTEEEEKLLEQHSTNAYGFFTHSAPKWDEINSKNLQARKNIKIISPGLQIATSNMIQGSTLQIPLTSNIGLQRQAFVLIHFDGAEPDLGRKGFQPELRILAEKLSSMIVSLSLKTRRELLISDGVSNSDQKKMNNYEYLKEVEKYEENNKLEINNESFFAPMKKISITSAPLSEQDVVVLFNQLIAGGVIRSIEILASSSYNQYDGVYRINIKEPKDNHYYDEKTNPLGILQENKIELGKMTSPLFLEYKYSFDSLIQDFENEDKSPSDIGLVVVWELGTRWKGEYQIISTLINGFEGQRRYHGLTHVIYDSNSSENKFDCIVLKELIEYLNSSENYNKNYSCIYKDILD